MSVKGATTLAARLVERYGMELTPPDKDWPDRLFPSPPVIAAADIVGLGMPQSRADTLTRLATAVADGTVDFNPGADADSVTKALLSLKGIGDWTAQYVRLRALGDPDAFPAGDLGLQKLATSGDRLSAKDLLALAESWRPWRGYAALHLWSQSSVPGSGKKT